MDLKEVRKRINEIEKEIKSLELDIMLENKSFFGVFQDQISDFGDLWAAEEIVHSQVLNRNLKLKKLEDLNERRSSLKVYGFQKSCKKCHEEIGYERLLIKPEVTRCVHCQDDFEEEQFKKLNRIQEMRQEYA